MLASRMVLSAIAFSQGCWGWVPFTAPMSPAAGAELDKTFNNPQPSRSSPPLTSSSEHQGHSSTVWASTSSILLRLSTFHHPHLLPT